MRLLCCGDFHLGAGSDYGAAPGDRLADQARVLRRIHHVATEEQVDGILFAGDAFERRMPSPAELMVWRGWLDLLGDDGLDIIGCAGNHDVSTAELPTGMEVVRGANGAYYDPLRRPGISYAWAHNDGPTIAVLPWTPPAHLVAASGGGDRDRIHEQAAELLVLSAAGLREQIDGPAILLAHWSVTGSSLPNGLPVDQLREPVLETAALEAQGWDFVVLGHIHKPQLMGSEDATGPMFYTSSPMPLNFGEASVEHGVWVIDTKHEYAMDDPVSYRFIPIESRPFVTVFANLTTDTWHYDRDAGEPSDETDAIAAAIAEHFPLTDAVVKIRYRATAEQARHVDQAALRGLLADAGVRKLYAIQPEIVRSERARVEGVDEGMEPIVALAAWAAANEVGSPDPLARLTDLTMGYLEEAHA